MTEAERPIPDRASPKHGMEGTAEDTPNPSAASRRLAKPVTRFVILATPRSGSNWLCTLLDSHPDILCHHELFNPRGIHYSLRCRDGRLAHLGSFEERNWCPAEFLERCWRESLGHAVVGFKLNRGQNQGIFRRVLSDSAVRKIVLTRANGVKAFVSELIAERTGLWESYPGMPVSAKAVKVKVDYEDMLRRIDENRRYLGELLEPLKSSGQEYLRTVYEDLAFDAERHRILRYLGVTPCVERLRTVTRKLNSTNLRDHVENFDEIEAEMSNSSLANQLRSVGP